MGQYKRPIGSQFRQVLGTATTSVRHSIALRNVPPAVRHSLSEVQQALYAQTYSDALAGAPRDFTPTERRRFAHQSAWSVARRSGAAYQKSRYGGARE